MSKVIFITGPSGSGKSTIAAQVAERWPSICALLDFDHLRTLIKSGYAEPSHGWNDECERQWALARDVIVSMIPVYAAHGVDMIVEAYANTGDYDLWQKAFGRTPYRTFVLLPPLDTVLARNAQRSGNAKLKEKDVRQNYKWSENWKEAKGVFIIENLTDSPRQTAEKIIKLAA